MSSRDRQVAFKCTFCGGAAYQKSSAVNRARRNGAPLYCNVICAGKARRVHRSDEEKRRIKAEYDRNRRAKLGDSLRKQKRDAYYRDHERHLAKQAELRRAIRADPERLAAYRDLMAKYRSRPDWRVHKAKYDRRYRAEKKFGPEWADAYLALLDLDSEINKMVPDRNELYGLKGTRNKAQSRKREYACRSKNSTQSI